MKVLPNCAVVDHQFRLLPCLRTRLARLTTQSRSGEPSASHDDREAWRLDPGPGRQWLLPAGSFEAEPGRHRLSAPGARVFGGFEEDMPGADRLKHFERI